ncbi:hypothetical protein BKA57DRAFT_431596 [Linnemannia elongata]|nr:hypothetical protein BKA57DRAFT_431596 [Linnemannia elongata]
MVQSTATSALFLKAKHAFSLHRKLSLNSSSSSTPSSPSPSPPSSSSSPTELNSSQLFSTALNTPPSSSSSSTNPSLTATTNSITDATVAPHKTKSKRSSRFKVKTFASFRDRSSSPPLTSSSTSFADPASSGSTASSSSSLPTPPSSSPGATTTPTVAATTNVTATSWIIIGIIIYIDFNIDQVTNDNPTKSVGASVLCESIFLVMVALDGVYSEITLEVGIIVQGQYKSGSDAVLALFSCAQSDPAAQSSD